MTSRDGSGPPPAGRSASPLDDVDRAIVEQLLADGRMAVTELAGRVGVSRTNAYARLERLRAEEVIAGFTVRVDHRRLGLELTALVTVASDQRKWRAAREQILAIPQVEYVAVTTGEFDFVLLVRVPDVETLRDVILERLRAIPEVRATRTIFVLDEVVRSPGAPS